MKERTEAMPDKSSMHPAERTTNQTAPSARSWAEQSLLDNLPVGIFRMVLSPGEDIPRFVFMNQNFMNLMGIEPGAEEQNPLKLFALIFPADYQKWVGNHAELFKRKPHFQNTLQQIVPGEPLWLSAEACPHVHSDGSTVWDGVLTNVTDHVIALQNMEAAQGRLERILSNLPFPVSVGALSEEASLDYVNKTFTKSFGYTLEDIPTLEQWALKSCPDPAYRDELFAQWAAHLHQAMAHQDLVEPIECRITCKDGKVRDVVVSALPDRDIVVTVMQDVTERKRAEAALRQVHQEILQQEVRLTQFKERERLLQDVHDGFGSQLATARLQIKHGELQLGEVETLLGECLNDLHLVVDTLSNESQSLQDGLVNLRQRLDRKGATQGVILTWDIRLAGCPRIDNRKTLHVLRILQEGINNAIKHAQAQAIRIETRYNPSGEIHLTVTDDGVGIPGEVRPGRGLGNMHCRAQNLGAQLIFTSANPGTCMRLILPA